MDTFEKVDGELVVARDCAGSEEQTVCQECKMAGCQGTIPCCSSERVDQRNVYFVDVSEYGK